MSDDEIKIAIAEACPTLFEIHHRYKNGDFSQLCVVLTRPGDWDGGEELDPLTDLNAIHEAEKTLTDGQAMEFERRLRTICAKLSYRHVISATARQRAEAFLRTIGKWLTEPQPS